MTVHVYDQSNVVLMSDGMTCLLTEINKNDCSSL